ncbi:MAG: hypothetical protein J6W49_04820 [Paludibacteraceae bacterium]|nr:hypothetical protein [Paludibacteraceae bacterium]
MKKSGIHDVVFNTGSGREVLKFVYSCLFSKIRFYGIQHNTYRFQHFGLQYLISLKMSKYFVLADYLSHDLPGFFRKRTIPFYPIYFKDVETVELDKPDDEFWVVIPGGVEFRRRNYVGLLDSLERKVPLKNIRFVILGRVSKKDSEFAYFESRLKAMNLCDRFVFLDKFIPNELFYSYINQADLILTLINTDATGRHFNYTTYQVSGTFNLSFAFKCPMLLEDYYKKHEPFASCSFFYGKSRLVDELNALADDGSKAKLRQKSDAISSNDSFAFASQQKRYMSAFK